MESPVKTDFRLTRRGTTIGGVDIAAGTPVMLLNGAANRDPRRFECPAEFRIDRAQRRSRTSRSAGATTRVRVARWRAPRAGSASSASSTGMRDIRLSEEHHGPPGARRFRYTPTWVLRGLDRAAHRVHACERRRVTSHRVRTGAARSSPDARSAARTHASRSSRFRTLPDGFRGSASMSTTSFGTLNLASCAAAVLDELLGRRRRRRRARTT